MSVDKSAYPKPSNKPLAVIQCSQPETQEGEAVPARKCSYCRVITNFNRGQEFPWPGKPDVFLSIDTCQLCGKGAYFRTGPGGDPIQDRYPTVESEPDEELPEDVKIPLREAYHSMDEKNWNASVTMARRALQEAVDDFEAEGDTLYKQIEYLASQQKITPDLKDWAHEGRLGGNLGAHGTKQKKWAEEEDAEEVLEFTKWFMRYAYVLPKQLKERREKVSGERPETQT